MQTFFRILNVTFALFLFLNGQTQIANYNKLDLHPVSPSAFQFLKYTEMPVSEYSGIPNISIPLHNVSVDGLNIPVQLTYHSNGIRTTQEASWVGLGWDLQFGSIVQSINDCDDFGGKMIGNQFVPNIKRKPDYLSSNGDGTPFKLPLRRKLPELTPGDGWSNPYPVLTPRYQQGFAISTLKHLPVDGQFDNQELQIFDANSFDINPNVDSEPDIFTATFLGETLKFTTNPSNSSTNANIIILNKGGFSIHKTSNGFKITNPSGCIFFFELKSEVQNLTHSTSFEGYSSSGLFEVTSNIFYLTKIITKYNSEIIFNYVYNGIHDTYPQYSEKYQAFLNSNFYTQDAPLGGVGGYTFANKRGSSGWLINPGVAQTFSLGKEDKYHLSSIVFPEGKLNFELSDRTDALGEKKVSSISLKNNADIVVKQWNFGYSYFESPNITAGYTYANGASLDNEQRSRLRLKLENLQEQNGGMYNFSYNSTILPMKNSKSQDYWGYFGGSNDLIPSSIEIGHPEIGIVGGGRQSYLNNAMACILTEIKYPTGGKVQLNYELNEFASTGMRGVNTNLQFMKGCGLRIKDIIHYDNITGKNLSTNYSYSDGILLSPRTIFRRVPYTRIRNFLTNPAYSNYEIEELDFLEISSNGVFSSDPLATSSGVGYGKVTKTTINQYGDNNGKVISFFYNYQDARSYSIENQVVYCGIPTSKSMLNGDIGIPNVQNGITFKQEFYNTNNKLQKRIEYEYGNRISDLVYGARIFPFGSLNYIFVLNGQNYTEDNSLVQHLVGYYPIFDVYSLMTKSTVTEYDENEIEKINVITNVSYTSADLVSGKCTISSEAGLANQRNSICEYINYPFDDLSIPSNNLLITKHRFDEVFRVKRSLITTDNNNYPTFSEQATLTNEYGSMNGQVVKTASTFIKNPGPNESIELTNYNLYDEKAKLLEYTKKGQKSSFLWGYGGEYVTAEIVNSSLSDCAYSSFETTETGNLTYTGSTLEDNTAPTGKRVFLLDNSNPNTTITKIIEPSKKYVVTLWKETNKIVLVNNNAPLHVIKQIGNWVLCEYRVDNSNLIQITGISKIDEVRVFPLFGQMTTYTYEPLIGMKSKCDVNNIISYFEYDELGRLKIIRDENKNIIKMHTYHLGQ